MKVTLTENLLEEILRAYNKENNTNITTNDIWSFTLSKSFIEINGDYIDWSVINFNTIDD